MSSISGASIVFCLTVITIDSHYNAATSKCFTLISDCSFLLASLCSRRGLQASLLQGSAAPVPSVFLQFPLCFLFPCPSLNAPCPITLSLTSAGPPSPFAPSAFHCRTLLKDGTVPIRTPAEPLQPEINLLVTQFCAVKTSHRDNVNNVIVTP